MFRSEMKSPASIEHKVFFEIHSNLPRESAGSIASTLRALDVIKNNLPADAVIADMGCGPGSSAIPLANALPEATIHAFDLHEPFLEEMTGRAADLIECGRLKPAAENMLSPMINPHSLDMIWSEGAIYNCGVSEGLKVWKEYLKPGGYLVFNDVVWLTPDDDRPGEVADFWQEYPGMGDINSVETAIKEAGYDLLGGFDLPEADWWTEYYNPMEDRLDELEDKYKNVAAAQTPLQGSRLEIDIRRRFSDHCNYRFFVTQLMD